MIAPLVIAGAMAAAQIAGSLKGNSAAAEREAQANDLRQKAMDMIAGIRVPTVEEQKLMLEHPEVMGELQPMIEQHIAQDPSAMEAIQGDPRLKAAQMSALDEMSGLSKGGLNDSDKAALEQIRRGAAAQDQAKQGQILQEMQARGQGGSGAELIARLKSAQSGADSAQSAGLEQAKMAQQRALQALSMEGSMSSQMRGQDFSEQSDVARAKDLINQFNTQNKQQVQGRNVSSGNQAQAANLTNKQNIANVGVDINNTQQKYNKELIRQKYMDDMSKAQVMTQMMMGQAAAANQTGGREAGMWTGIGNSVAGGIGGMAGGIGGIAGGASGSSGAASASGMAGGGGIGRKMMPIG